MRHMKHATNGITRTQRARLKRIAEHRGLFARVAKGLNLGPNGRSHVRRVAMGERRSRRVEAALRAALDKLEREAA